ncbi:unnamed protein product [Arabis nemorensis]|uniref:Uncharacterized protein n=1 Tax=Arabis nemorensis TaxID=586526 RepID=A0A565BAI1_9BRAS|nr:unnamed protein product [Arabis nemorensis]
MLFLGSYIDLWPCTSKELDHLVRQELLVKNMNKKVEKTILPHGSGAVEFASSANPVAASALNTFPTSLPIFYGKSLLTNSKLSNTQCGCCSVNVCRVTYQQLKLLSRVSLLKAIAPGQNDPSGQEEDDTATIQSQPLPTDVFRLRQMRKARGILTSSQTPTGSTSHGSAFSGELSGSTG